MKPVKNTSQSWKGQWISSNQAIVSEEPEFTLAEMFSGKTTKQKPVDERLHPVVYFKKMFSIQKPVKKASLEITAQGIYLAYLNGRKTTAAIFTPDYTNYHEFLQYQTYDVTDKLVNGLNKLCIEVADGWYAGRISVPGGSAQFGKQLALLADLNITYQDNTHEIIGSDRSFSTGSGKHRYADIEIGEKQDLRISDAWLNDDRNLNQTAIEINASYACLAPQEGPLVIAHQSLRSQKIWSEENSLIVDFGQVLAGRVRLTAKFEPDQQIILQHSEVLDKNGHFFKNIIGRNKDQTDVFIGNGQVMTVEPDFTFHGFRYVKIIGLALKSIIEIEAVPIYSNMSNTGWITTDDATINQLLSNINWSQRGNMLSIPTDCPQRERVGWTGDMQVFVSASTFFMNTEDFIRRWLKNVRIDQRANGEILDVSPSTKDSTKSVDFTGSYSSAGWGDAIVMVPWSLYQHYGHVQVLQENYAAMKKWLSFAKKSAAGNKSGDRKYLWDTKFHYGDWMLPSLMLGDNPNPMATSAATKNTVATAFLKHVNDLMAKISEILGEDGTKYHNYARNVQRAFTKYYVSSNYHLQEDYQGCYVLAIAFDLVPKDIKAKLVKQLVEKIHENNDLLDTGFLATPYLLDVLTDNGQTKLAQKLFLQDECPSWLYEVKSGATTVWESWAGIQPDGTVGEFSFNHYAMGCVLDWFVRKVIGLNPLAPGYKRIKIDPQIRVCRKLQAAYESASGLITIKLEFQSDRRLMVINIPKAVTADIYLHYSNEQEKQKLLEKYSWGVLKEQESCMIYSVGAGNYQFEY